MKKIFPLLLVLVLSVSVVLPVSAKPSGMLVLGDSIATGYGLPNYSAPSPQLATDSFGNRLAAEYGLSYGHTYYNFAVNGMTSEELAAALTDGTSQYVYRDNALGFDEATYSMYQMVDASATKVAVKNCDTIIISIGGNDLLRPLFEILTEYVEQNASLIKGLGIDMTGGGVGIGAVQSMMGGAAGEMMAKMLTALLTSDTAKARFEAGIADYAENLAAITDAIYKTNPNADVYFLCLYDPFDGISMFGDMTAMADEFIIGLENATLAHAKAVNAKGRSFTPVLMREKFAGNAMTMTNMLAFDIHPNVNGHAAIFDSLKAAIDTPKSAPGTAYSPNTFDMLTLAVCAASLSAVGIVSAKKKK